VQTEVLGRYGISRYNYKCLETKIGNSQQLAAVLCGIVSLIRGVLRNLIVMKRPGIPEVGAVAAWFRGPVCCCQSHCPISTVVLKTTAGFCHVIIPTETLIGLRFSGPHY